MEASAFGNPLLSTLEGSYSFYGGSILFVLSLIFLITTLPIPPESKPFPGFKLYGNLPGDPSFTKTKAQYATYGGTWIKNAYQQARGKAFQIITGTGPMIILPPTLIDEVRNNGNMTLSGFLEHIIQDWDLGRV
ncbi:putative cytochrome p450 protein [Lasiodiplodia theobromae]|nr:putative cytochrome p450 protein [Lasiodiplodia theobromae]